ncbi:MAG: sinR 6 [Lachnospiraceae bacterium]|jgi:transcriptional regulator with XRE-family HTH domain|nr:sinR 6 [Lachnospiraceae bacterium]
MNDVSKIIGDRVRIIRNSKGLSIEELAHRADISNTHLGHIERGDRSPTVEMLGKIVIALDISFAELFSDFPMPNSENDTVLTLFINRLNTLNNSEQKIVLDIIENLFKLAKSLS